MRLRSSRLQGSSRDGIRTRGFRSCATTQRASVTFESPRGAFTLSKAHNPVQDVYLRKVEGTQNKVQAVAIKALADPARGCRL